jgi:hypothetical protein
MNRAKTDKHHSRGISRDMSPAAIAHRLDIVSQLRAFTQYLAEAKPIGPAKKEVDPELSDSRER